MARELGPCMVCVKYSLFIFNFIFWAAGCGLVGVGIWVFVDARRLVQIYVTNVPGDVKESIGHVDVDVVQAAGVAVLIIGATIMISGFLGCCGSIRESRALLAMFFAVLFLIFALLIAIGIAGIVKAEWLKELLAKAMQVEISNTNSTNRRGNTLLYYSHRTYGCCGIDNMPTCDRDYPPYDVIPKPCAIGMDSCRKGCLDTVWSIMSRMALGGGIAALIAGFIVIFGMIFTMCLCLNLKQRDSYYY